MARPAAMFPLLIALGACSGELSALDPAGPAAARVETLWQIMLWSAGVILAGVVGTAIYAVATSGRERNFSTRRVLVGWGLVFPSVVLTALMGFAFLRGEQLLARGEEDESALIRVHAQQWQWRFAYPGGAQSTGVLHVPAGREFTVAITSGDVIHSFWVRGSAARWMQCRARPTTCDSRPTCRGSITGNARNIAGRFHAHMQFQVHAHAPADYAAALVTAADDVPAEPLPVLDQRPAPAGSVIEEWATVVLEAVGLK